MNYFKITMAGESKMSHDEIAEHLGTIMDFAEQTIHGEIGILTYSPTDEQGEALKAKPSGEMLMLYIWEGINDALGTDSTEVSEDAERIYNGIRERLADKGVIRKEE